MFKLFFLSLAALLFIGCTGLTKPDFQISSFQNNNFGNKTKTETHGLYNRVSKKSICGGIHIDDKGLYLDPVANFGKNNQIEEIALISIYTSAINTDELHNAVCNKKGFEFIREIVFLADARKISIQARPYDIDLKYYGWNPNSQNYDGVFREVSVSLIDLNDLTTIANAKNLNVKVVGGKNSQTFENSELEDDFRTNLKSFIKAITR